MDSLRELQGGSTSHYKIPRRAAPPLKGANCNQQALSKLNQSQSHHGIQSYGVNTQEVGCPEIPLSKTKDLPLRSRHNQRTDEINKSNKGVFIIECEQQVKQELIMALATTTDYAINQANKSTLIDTSTAAQELHNKKCVMPKQTPPLKSSSCNGLTNYPKLHVRFDDYLDLSEQNIRKSCKKLMQDLYANHKSNHQQPLLPMNMINEDRCNSKPSNTTRYYINGTNQDSIDHTFRSRSASDSDHSSENCLSWRDHQHRCMKKYRDHSSQYPSFSRARSSNITHRQGYQTVMSKQIKETSNCVIDLKKLDIERITNRNNLIAKVSSESSSNIKMQSNLDRVAQNHELTKQRFFEALLAKEQGLDQPPAKHQQSNSPHMVNTPNLPSRSKRSEDVNDRDRIVEPCEQELLIKAYQSILVKRGLNLETMGRSNVPSSLSKEKRQHQRVTDDQSFSRAKSETTQKQLRTRAKVSMNKSSAASSISISSSGSSLFSSEEQDDENNNLHHEANPHHYIKFHDNLRDIQQLNYRFEADSGTNINKLESMHVNRCHDKTNIRSYHHRQRRADNPLDSKNLSDESVINNNVFGRGARKQSLTKSDSRRQENYANLLDYQNELDMQDAASDFDDIQDVKIVMSDSSRRMRIRSQSTASSSMVVEVLDGANGTSLQKKPSKTTSSADLVLLANGDNDRLINADYTNNKSPQMSSRASNGVVPNYHEKKRECESSDDILNDDGYDCLPERIPSTIINLRNAEDDDDENDLLDEMSSIIYTIAKPMHVYNEDCCSEKDAHDNCGRDDMTAVAGTESTKQQFNGDKLVVISPMMKNGPATSSNLIHPEQHKRQIEISKQLTQFKTTADSNNAKSELKPLKIAEQLRTTGEEGKTIVDRRHSIVENSPAALMLNQVKARNKERADFNDKSNHDDDLSTTIIVADNNNYNSTCHNYPNAKVLVVSDNNNYSKCIKSPTTKNVLSACSDRTSNVKAKKRLHHNECGNCINSEKVTTNELAVPRYNENNMHPIVDTNIYCNISVDDSQSKVELTKISEATTTEEDKTVQQTINLDSILQQPVAFISTGIEFDVVDEQRGNLCDIRNNKNCVNMDVTEKSQTSTMAVCHDHLNVLESLQRLTNEHQETKSDDERKNRFQLMNDDDRSSSLQSPSPTEDWHAKIINNTSEHEMKNDLTRPDSMLLIDVAENEHHDILCKNNMHTVAPSSFSSSANGVEAGGDGGASSTSSRGTSGLGASASVSSNSQSEDSASEDIKLTLSLSSPTSSHQHEIVIDEGKRTNINHHDLPLSPDQIYPQDRSSNVKLLPIESRHNQQVYAIVNKQVKTASIGDGQNDCKHHIKTNKTARVNLHPANTMQLKSQQIIKSDDKFKKYLSDMALSTISGGSKKDHHLSIHELDTQSKIDSHHHQKSFLKKFGKLVSRAFTSSDNSTNINSNNIILKQDSDNNKGMVDENKNSFIDDDKDNENNSPSPILRKNSQSRKSFISRFIIQRSNCIGIGPSLRLSKARSSINRKSKRAVRPSRPSLTGQASEDNGASNTKSNIESNENQPQITSGTSIRVSQRSRILASSSRGGSYRKGSYSKRVSKRRPSLEAALAANTVGLRKNHVVKNCSNGYERQNADLIILPPNCSTVDRNRFINNGNMMEQQPSIVKSACDNGSQYQLSKMNKVTQRSQQQQDTFFTDDSTRIKRIPIDGCDPSDLAVSTRSADEESIRVNKKDSLQKSHHDTLKSSSNSTSSTFLQNIKQRMSFRRRKSPQEKLTSVNENKHNILTVDDKDLRVIVTNTHTQRNATLANARHRARDRPVNSSENTTNGKLKAQSLGKNNGFRQARQLTSSTDTNYRNESGTSDSLNHKSLLSHFKTRSNTNLAIISTRQDHTDFSNKENKHKSKSSNATSEGVWGRLIKISKSDGTSTIELNRAAGTPWGFFVAIGSLNNIKGVYISRMYDGQATESLTGLISPGDRILAINDKSIEHQPDYPISEVNKQIGKSEKILLKLKPYNKDHNKD